MRHLLIVDHFSNAVASLKSNRTRTTLTGLGIAIGVGSITAILALSAGFVGIIDRQINALENNLAIVRPLTASTDIFSTVQPTTASSLTADDYEKIESLEGAKNIAPLMVINSKTKSKDQTVTASVVGSTPDLKNIASLEVRDGQFIDETTNQKTAVIGRQLSIDLFGTEQSIGQTFTVRGNSFTVIGILRGRDDPINFNGIDFNSSAIIHLAAGQKLRGVNAPLQQIDLQASSPSKLSDLIERVDTQLASIRGGEKDYQIISGGAIAEPTSQLFDIVQRIVVIVAGISLVVGGIGIMNIMLVSVAERTREIGLRKAIGASNGHIIAQFLIESLMISAVGGIGGYIMGYVAAFAISTLLPFPPVFNWMVVGIAAALSFGIGVMFGLYPAIKASRKNPIESLRYYQ